MRYGDQAIFWIGLLATLALCGCVSNFLDPDFLSAVGLGGSPAAIVPGDAPAIDVSVENRTDRVVQVFVSYRSESDTVKNFTAFVDGGRKRATALPCPVSELTLGDVSDLSRIGAIVVLGAGGADDPFIELEPFGVLLRAGSNYDCGDKITFTISPSGANRSGFQIIAFIQRSGTTTTPTP